MDSNWTLEIDSVDFTFDVGEYTEPEDLEWLPDAADFILQIHEKDREVTEYQYGYTCLKHIFLLLNRLKTRESGRFLWGTGLGEIRFEGDEVKVFGNPELVGTVDDFRSTTEDLARQIFEYIRQHDVDTRSIATNIAKVAVVRGRLTLSRFTTVY